MKLSSVEKDDCSSNQGMGFASFEAVLLRLRHSKALGSTHSFLGKVLSDVGPKLDLALCAFKVCGEMK